MKSFHVFVYPISLRGRRLKGKGKGVLGARETRGDARGGRGGISLAPSLLVRPSRFPRAQNPLSFPFQTLATQANILRAS